MRFKARAICIGALCVTTCLALIGTLSSTSRPASAQSADKVVKGGTINVAQGSWATLDPGASISQLSVAPIYGMVYGHLFFQNTKGVISPDLALRYRTAPDGRSGELFLRHGVKFSDGTPFNAQAVVWNFKRYESAATPGPCPCKPQLSLVTSQQAKGQDEVVFHFSRPFDDFQMLLAQAQFTFMLSPTAYQKEGATQFGIHPVGAGPFTVRNNNVGVTMTVVKNPAYWQTGQPYLKQINITAISDSSALYTGVRSGTLAFASFSAWSAPTYVDQSKGDPNLTVVTQPLLNNMFVQLNTKKAPFNNPKARQAIYEATNPEPIVKALLRGASVAHVLNPPAAEYFPGNKTVGEFKYNLADAKRLVQQLGGLTTTLIPGLPDPNIQAIEEALQQQWEQAGIKVSVTSISHAEEVQEQATGGFEAILANFGNYIDPFLTVEPFVSSGTTTNAYGYHSAKVDSLLIKIQQTKASDKAAIADDWKQIATLENEAAGTIPLFFGSNATVINKKLHGVQFEGEQIYYEKAWWSGQ